MTDTISRQGAIDDLKGKDPSQIWDTADVEVWINSLPSAERKKGKWIEKRTYSGERPIGEWQSCKCSVCNRYDNRPYLYYFSEPKFCSWCGARMDGEDDEN